MFTQASFDPIPDHLSTRIRVRASSLMEFAQSPAQYESTVLLGEKEETPAMALGTAVHKRVLEPEKFEKAYCEELRPLGHHLATAEQLKQRCKDLGLGVTGTKAVLTARLLEAGVDRLIFLDEAKKDHEEGREVLSAKEMHACNRIAGRIVNDPELRFLLSEGVAERQGWAEHKETGIVVTFTPDYYRRFKQPFKGAAGIVIDLKKYRAQSERQFEAAIWDAKLFIQAALYRDVIDLITGEKNLFGWVVCDEKPPYPVVSYYAIEPMLEAGRAQYEKALVGIRDCCESERWPQKQVGIRPVSLPQYAWDQLEYSEGGI
jgi:hypothetical protein